MKVAVIGAGIHGASSALALAKRGHSVTVFDRYPLGHNLGSSHGRSRIIRKAYPDPFYTQIMLEAYPMWDQLQLHSDLPIVNHSGLLYFGSRGSADVISVRESLASYGVEHRVLKAKDVPDFVLAENEIAIHSEDGGWVHADNAVRAALFQAIELGTSFIQEDAPPFTELEAQFDRIVVAPGAWIKDFVNLDVEVKVQTVAYVRHRYDGPVWIEDGPDLLYGFPSEPGEDTMKIGVHLMATTWQQGEERPVADEKLVERIRDFARQRFGIANPEVVETVTCLYTSTADEDFRWGRLGEKGFYVSACSGHGFKFGPWIGERLADMAEGSSEPEAVSRFCK